MADLDMWRAAAPDGQRLVAAAPMVGNWVPRAVLILALTPMLSQIPVLTSLLILPRWPLLGLSIFPIGFAAALALLFGWARRWRRHHPPPSGMAAVFKARRNKGLVLIITDSAVLLTETKGSLRSPGVKPAGVGRPIPGLTAIDASDDLLVVSFADGSEASLRQRAPDRSACDVGAKVAALAAAAMGQGRDCLHKDEELEDDSAQPRG